MNITTVLILLISYVSIGNEDIKNPNYWLTEQLVICNNTKSEERYDSFEFETVICQWESDTLTFLIPKIMNNIIYCISLYSDKCPKPNKITTSHKRIIYEKL